MADLSFENHERRHGRLGHAFAAARRLPLLSGAIIAAALLAALLAPWIAPYDPAAVDLLRRFAPPAWMEGGSSLHLLGSDDLGRDVLSRLIWGARVALLGAATIATPNRMTCCADMSPPFVKMPRTFSRRRRLDRRARNGYSQCQFIDAIIGIVNTN